jgi:hypothetical protein
MPGRSLFRCALLVLLASCADSETTAPAAQRANPAGQLVSLSGKGRIDSTIVARLSWGGVFAEGSYLACIASYQAQGVPLQQTFELCKQQLSIQGERGWGADAEPFSMPPGFDTAFDASKVTSNCAVGDSRYAAGPGVKQYSTDDKRNPFDETKYAREYNWGGFTSGGNDKSGHHGLTKEQAAKEKLENITAAEAAIAEANEAQVASENDPKSVLKAAEAAEKKRLADEAASKALKDPNKKEAPPVKVQPPPPGQAVAHTGENPTGCEQILQIAREFLAECHRTGWKTTGCQQLHAATHGCPDPTLIYVDPDAGYACAAPVDSAAVIEAWRSRCERLTRPGPDGGSPCSKPTVSHSGHVVRGDELDICTNPQALSDPEFNGCIRPIEIDPFGKTDVGGLIIWGQGVFGGPLVVLPPPPPPFPPRG